MQQNCVWVCCLCVASCWSLIRHTLTKAILIHLLLGQLVMFAALYTPPYTPSQTHTSAHHLSSHKHIQWNWSFPEINQSAFWWHVNNWFISSMVTKLLKLWMETVLKPSRFRRVCVCVCVLGSPWLSGFPLLLRPTVGAVLSCMSALLWLQICCGMSWPWCQPPQAAIWGQWRDCRESLKGSQCFLHLIWLLKVSACFLPVSA